MRGRTGSSRIPQCLALGPLLWMIIAERPTLLLQGVEIVMRSIGCHVLRLPWACLPCSVSFRFTPRHLSHRCRWIQNQGPTLAKASPR